MADNKNLVKIGDLTFTDEQVRELNELIMLKYVTGESFTQLHNFQTGIVTGKKIGFVGEMGMVGVKSTGCDPSVQAAQISASEKTWTPKEWEILLSQCADDLEATLGVYIRKLNPESYDLTNTAYMQLVADKLIEAMNKMFWRIAWLGDEDAANFDGSPAGEITDGIDAKYFSLLDGFWKQIYAVVAADASRRVTVAANAQSTYATQLNETNFSPLLAFGYLQQLTYNAHPALRQATNKVGLATRSFVDRAEQYLMEKSIVPTYENLVNGVQALRINGQLWVPLDIWDEQIRAYQADGTKYIRPHRALLTTADNLAVGVPATDRLERFDIWYNKDERKNKIEAIDKLDVKILQDNLVQVAY